MLCLQAFFHVSISVFGAVCSLPSIYSLFISSIKYLGIQFVSVYLQSLFLFYSAILSSCIWALVLLNLCYQAVLFITWRNDENPYVLELFFFFRLCLLGPRVFSPPPSFLLLAMGEMRARRKHSNYNPHRDCLIHISQSAHPAGLPASPFPGTHVWHEKIPSSLLFCPLMFDLFTQLGFCVETWAKLIWNLFRLS